MQRYFFDVAAALTFNTTITGGKSINPSKRGGGFLIRRTSPA